MKRSEMIEKLHNSLVGKFIPYYNPEFNDKIEELLTEIEESGMLPPFVGVGEEDDWGFLDYENKWEPEDET